MHDTGTNRLDPFFNRVHMGWQTCNRALSPQRLLHNSTSCAVPRLQRQRDSTSRCSAERGRRLLLSPPSFFYENNLPEPRPPPPPRSLPLQWYSFCYLISSSLSLLKTLPRIASTAYHVPRIAL